MQEHGIHVPWLISLKNNRLTIVQVWENKIYKQTTLKLLPEEETDPGQYYTSARLNRFSVKL